MHFRQVVDLCRGRSPRARAGTPGRRRGLLEAYIRLGRAYGFAARITTRPRLVPEGRRAWPSAGLSRSRADAEAAAMLAWSYRKIADIGKLSGRVDAAQRRLPQGDRRRPREPQVPPDRPRSEDPPGHRRSTTSRECSTTVATWPGPYPLTAEAERHFLGLPRPTPRTRRPASLLVHAQYDPAPVQRDLGRFSEAVACYRRTIDSLSHVPAESAFPPTPPPSSCGSKFCNGKWPTLNPPCYAQYPRQSKLTTGGGA